MFRFEDLEIWNEAVEVSGKLFQVANQLENENKFRFAEQLRGATLSITNNIAEGSGASTDKDFQRYLGIARSSVFENVNMIQIFEKQNLIDTVEKNNLIPQLEALSKKITAFQSSLGE